MILQSVFAALVEVFIVLILGASGALFGFPIFVSLPISISAATLILYAGSFISIPATLIIPFSVFATLFFLFVLKLFKFNITAPKIPKLYFLAILIVSAALLIPRINFLTLPFAKEIHFPYIGDETKHVSVLTSIASSRNFPPRFPYDPTQPFAYYYFFYLIPGSILKLFPHANPGIIWFVHVFLSQIIVLGVFATGICALTTKRKLRLLGVGLMFFGSSFKLIPKLFHFWGITEPHIEHWWQIPGDSVWGKPALIGWQITHPVTLAVWTPQHQWAAMLCVIIFILVLQKKLTIPFFIVVAILLTTLIGTSAFVAVSFLLVLGLYMLVTNRSIRDFLTWGVTLALPLLLTFPLLKVFSSNQAGIIFAPYLPYLPHIPYFPGILVFYLFETGFVIPVIILLLLLKKSVFKENMFRFLFLATVVPLIISRLVVSQFMNDIGMRIPIVYTAFMPFLVIYLLDKVHKGMMEKIAMIFLAASVLFGASAGLLEVYFQSSKSETYTELTSRLYQVIIRYTNPDDIIVVNDAYFADRIPLFSGRMTIKPEIPFSMDVYVPKRKTGEKYPTAMCPIYIDLRKKLPSAHVVYAELANVAPLPCKEIEDKKSTAPVLFTSPGIILYRL